MTNFRSPDTQSIWHDLEESERIEIKNAMRLRKVSRGELLIQEGSPSHTLFIVNVGLFEVRARGVADVIAEIGKGQLIGEMGFFSGEPRNASVIAVRNSEVLEIDLSDFEKLGQNVQRAISRSLARRLTHLAESARDGWGTKRPQPMRMAALLLIRHGNRAAEFLARISKTSRFLILTSLEAETHFGGGHSDAENIRDWLFEIERKNDFVLCICDKELTSWTQAVLRSADQLVLVAEGAPSELSETETIALEVYPPARRRLVLLHACRHGVSPSTEQWLERHDVFMVHHIAIEDQADLDRLRRFLAGEAIGFVAGGGGAFGLAHIGIFKAFRENGVVFDMHGGSSIGSAMTAAFSQLKEPDEIEAGVHEFFVRRRAMRRLAFPRYGLLDHTVLDEALRAAYGSANIEDLWKPFFAIATDLSTYEMRIIRTGAVWQAVRASCAIPGVLPPFFDNEGHMLVDGGVVDNVPSAAMNSLKTGPNLVVDLRDLDHHVYDFTYKSIPGRRVLLACMVNPLARHKLPSCPWPTAVIQQSIFSNIRSGSRSTGAQDLVLRPPPFPGSSFLNWDRHREVVATSYQWTLQTIEQFRKLGDPVFAEMERLSKAE
jgi:NTE family protein